MSIIAKDPVYQGNRRWKVTTDPTVEPVTAAELKTFARIDGDDEDTLLENFIESARQLTEKYLGRALIQQTVTIVFDSWPGVVTKLPRPPLISVSSVSTIDEDDTATTYSSDNYYVRTIPEPGELILKKSVTHPYNTDRVYGGYRVIFLAGYGTAADDVPQAIKDSIKMWATDMYENRIVSPDPPDKAKPLLDKFKIARIAY